MDNKTIRSKAILGMSLCFLFGSRIKFLHMPIVIENKTHAHKIITSVRGIIHCIVITIIDTIHVMMIIQPTIHQ